MTSVLNFLTSLYERGIGHSQINKARSALSVIYPDVAIGKHPFISRFVRGVRNLRSGQVKYPLLWDAKELLNHLISWNVSSDSSVQDISRKLVATLACVSAQRVHTLSLIDFRYIFFFDSATYLYIFSDLKVQRDRPCFVITLPSHTEQDCLHTVHLLKLYLRKTRSIRQDSQLFLGCRPPYRPVTTDTLARWIRSVMKDAGIDISVFGAHSVRGASASFALQQNAPIDSVLQCGDWSCLNTFSKHYGRVNKCLSSKELSKTIVQHSNDSSWNTH